MTEYLIATSSIHVTASACDFLEGRADGEDAVWVLAVREAGADARDAEDALNVAEVRLGARVAVDTETRDGDPADRILEAAEERGADVIVIGPWAGTPGSAGTLGGTARTVIERADRPVVVVPLDALA